MPDIGWCHRSYHSSIMLPFISFRDDFGVSHVAVAVVVEVAVPGPATAVASVAAVDD